MGIILSTPASLGKRKSPKTRRNTTSLDWSPFRLLPNEIILHISSFLPPDAVAALALSCQPLRLVLSYTSFHLPWEDKLNFLQLLERDLPGHVVCRYCRKLHAIEKAELYLLTRTMRAPYSACRWEQMWSNIDVYFHKGFSIVVFEMALKQHRQRLDTSRILRLLSSKARTYPKDEHIEQHSALARIVRNCLIIREQRVCLMRASHQDPLPRNANFIICPHFTLSSMEKLNCWADQFGRPDPSGPEVCPPGTGLIRCLYCYTEFRVDFKSFGNSGTGVSLTIWKDLGVSLLDDKWQGHIGSLRKVDLVQFERGSICTAFENGDYRLFKPDWSLDAEIRERLLKGRPSAMKMFR